jgi:hypothetical protein
MKINMYFFSFAFNFILEQPFRSLGIAGKLPHLIQMKTSKLILNFFTAFLISICFLVSDTAHMHQHSEYKGADVAWLFHGHVSLCLCVYSVAG